MAKKTPKIYNFKLTFFRPNPIKTAKYCLKEIFYFSGTIKQAKDYGQEIKKTNGLKLSITTIK